MTKTKQQEQEELARATADFLKSGGKIEAIETLPPAQDYTVLAQQKIRRKNTALLEDINGRRIAVPVSQDKPIETGKTYSITTSTTAGNAGAIMYEGEYYNIAHAIDKISPSVMRAQDAESEESPDQQKQFFSPV